MVLQLRQDFGSPRVYLHAAPASAGTGFPVDIDRYMADLGWQSALIPVPETVGNDPAPDTGTDAKEQDIMKAPADPVQKLAHSRALVIVIEEYGQVVALLQAFHDRDILYVKEKQRFQDHAFAGADRPHGADADPDHPLLAVQQRIEHLIHHIQQLVIVHILSEEDLFPSKDLHFQVTEQRLTVFPLDEEPCSKRSIRGNAECARSTARLIRPGRPFLGQNPCAHHFRDNAGNGHLAEAHGFCELRAISALPRSHQLQHVAAVVFPVIFSVLTRFSGHHSTCIILDI